MAESFDAVKMVREIRDRLSEEMRNIDAEKLVTYINTRGKKALEALRDESKKSIER